MTNRKNTAIMAPANSVQTVAPEKEETEMLRATDKITALYCRLSQEEQDRVIAQHPDCWISFSGAQPYGVGWRYGEDELKPLDHYKVIRTVFRLDLDPNIPNHVGWYLKDAEREAVNELEAAMDAALASRKAAPAEEPVAEETVPEETVVEETTPEETTA